MAKEQEPEMTDFTLYIDSGQVIKVEFELDELETARNELEAAMQSGAAWYVGDYHATLNGKEVDVINTRRVVAYM